MTGTWPCSICASWRSISRRARSDSVSAFVASLSLRWASASSLAACDIFCCASALSAAASDILCSASRMLRAKAISMMMKMNSRPSIRSVIEAK
jgi:hypothetical protein